MNATVTKTRVGAFDAFVIENALIRATVIPELGGRIWELLDRVRDRQWIWHREGVSLDAARSGGSYDDVWAGGWEELFPNDAPGEFEGQILPDHGEWWSTAWTVAAIVDGAHAVLRLVAELHARNVSCVKEIRLARDSETIQVSYRIESMEKNAFHFLFKQHFPVAISRSCELTLPGGQVSAVDPAFGTLLPGPGPFPWPLAGHDEASAVDLRQVSATGTDREFIYVSELGENWCGVDDLEARASLRMRFDDQLPFVWLFLTYNGWRDCFTAVLEPCTNMPKNLNQAVRDGTSARLEPGKVFHTRVEVTAGKLIPRD